MTRAVYTLGEKISRDQGIIIADTKFEFGRDGDGRIILIDEVMTPDSSRFWAADAYNPASRSRVSTSSRCAIISTPSAAPAAGTAKRRRRRLPASVVDATSKRYLEAYRRVTGADLKIEVDRQDRSDRRGSLDSLRRGQGSACHATGSGRADNFAEASFHNTKYVFLAVRSRLPLTELSGANRTRGQSIHQSRSEAAIAHGAQ